MKNYCRIASIDPENEMFRARLDVGNHFEAVEVVGQDFDECITRAVIVRDAFNGTKTVKENKDG